MRIDQRQDRPFPRSHHHAPTLGAARTRLTLRRVPARDVQVDPSIAFQDGYYPSLCEPREQNQADDDSRAAPPSASPIALPPAEIRGASMASLRSVEGLGSVPGHADCRSCSAARRGPGAGSFDSPRRSTDRTRATSRTAFAVAYAIRSRMPPGSAAKSRSPEAGDRTTEPKESARRSRGFPRSCSGAM